MLHAVIMAGGAGTRFWPASRASLPKQLLDLTGGRTMIQATVDRLEGLVPAERVLVITNQQLTGKMREQLPKLKPESIIGEPCKRDTAPCIGLAAQLVAAEDPDAIMLVLPADHVIQTNQQFQAAVQRGLELITEDRSRIVTFGIRPTYPADTYGYIERSDVTISGGAYRAKRFREKPKVEVAKSYLEAGTFYWNSGIFMWTARTILEAIQEREPAMFAHLLAIANDFRNATFESTFQREFSAIQGKSIDYAVMEHHPNVVVIEATFDWDDVGNWGAISRLRGVDGDGNTLVGRHLGINTKNSTVRTDDKHLVVTLGVDNLIVVHTPDATLVANKNDEESIRKIVQILTERGWTEYL